jgi:hypothetical protein
LERRSSTYIIGPITWMRDPEARFLFFKKRPASMLPTMFLTATKFWRQSCFQGKPGMTSCFLPTTSSAVK